MTDNSRPPRAPTGEEILKSGFAQPASDGTVRAVFERPTVSRRVAVTNVPVYAGDPPSDETKAIGSPGAYEVTFILDAPGNEVYLRQIDVAAFLSSGFSLLQLPAGSNRVRINVAGDGTTEFVHLLPNAAGLIATAIVKLHAATFADAERAAHDLLAPALSWWSYRYDVPVDIKGWMVYEIATKITRLRFGVLARPALTDDNSYFSRPEYRFVLSAYREGMNATNPIYQALCFFRVIEGAYRLRSQRRSAAGAAFREPDDETMPAGDQLERLNFHDRAAIRPYAGRAFGRVREQLRELVRNAAAHLDPTGQQETLMADRFADVTRCEDAALVLKHMARVVVANELRADNWAAPPL